MTLEIEISREHKEHGMLELEVTLFDEDYVEKNNPLFFDDGVRPSRR